MSERILKREISGLTALTVVVGTVIGAGVFFKPTAVYGAAGSSGMGLLAWLVGGIIAIAGGLTVAEIGTAIPRTGGMMVYLEDLFGKPWGFLVGWAQLIVYFPANIAALSIIFATQMINLLGLGISWLLPISIGSVCFLTLINALGNHVTSFFQGVATTLKLVPLGVLIVAGLFFNNAPLTVELWPSMGQGSRFLNSFGTSLLATLFAYDGWINVGTLAGEMKQPRRDLPRAIIGGLSIVISIYLLINLAYLSVLSADQLASTVTPAADVASLLFPGFGSRLVTIGILISVFGGTNGYIMLAWRIPYTLGKQEMLPGGKWLATLHPKTKMPINGGLVILVLTVVMILSGSFNQLTDLSIFVIWFFNTLTFAGIFVIRRRKMPIQDTYKVPLYPFTPIVAILAGCFVFIITLVTQPLNALLGIGLTLLGLPLYFWQQKAKK